MTKIMSKEDTVKEIDRQTNATGRKVHRNARWMKRWSPSSHFVLMTIPLQKIEQPLKPHYMKIVAKRVRKFNKAPIFIDKNNPKLTTWTPDKTHGKKLDTLVIDGKHRHMAATLLGHKSMKAWVGVQAVSHFSNKDSQGYNWMDYSKKMLKLVHDYRNKREAA